MITGERVEFTMSHDSSVSLSPGSGSLTSASDSPEPLHSVAFSLEIQIDHGWRSMRILGTRWDEKLQMFLIHVAYLNASGSPQLCEGGMRALFAGRVVLNFPRDPQSVAVLLPAGSEIRTACAFKM